MKINDLRLSQCSACGGWFDAEAGFAKNNFRRGDMHVTTRRAVCIGCEQQARDEEKRGDRWLVKARDAIRRHASRRKMNAKDFARTFGWDARRIAHDLEHAHENTCSYCYHPYKAMPHGIGSVTVDVIDVSREPYYD